MTEAKQELVAGHDTELLPGYRFEHPGVIAQSLEILEERVVAGNAQTCLGRQAFEPVVEIAGLAKSVAPEDEAAHLQYDNSGQHPDQQCELTRVSLFSPGHFTVEDTPAVGATLQGSAD